MNFWGALSQRRPAKAAKQMLFRVNEMDVCELVLHISRWMDEGKPNSEEYVGKTSGRWATKSGSSGFLFRPTLKLIYSIEIKMALSHSNRSE